MYNYRRKHLLTSPQQWKKDLVTMSSRLLGVRQKLHKQLLDLGTPGDWSHIINQIGMFTYTGLTCTY